MKLSSDTATRILEASVDAVIVVDTAGDIVFVNRRAETLFGYAPSELIGQPVEILLPESQRAAHVGHRQSYERSPHERPLVSGLNLRALRKDGESFSAEIALTPLDTNDGMMIASTIRDLAADRSSERYFRNLIESAPDAMIIVDHVGKILIVNQQTENMFGYTRGELIGQPIEMLLPDSVRTRHRVHRDTYLEKPKVRPMGSGMALTGLRKNGEEFSVEISLSPVSDGRTVNVASVIRDVTERKRLESELIDARHEAERANKANTAFLAAASHDLRQPVQALSLLNGALRRTVKESVAQEMLESQQLSLDAMTNLLNSLLDISRLDAGAVQPEFEDFPIQRLIDRLAAEFARQASNKQLKFHAADCPVVVHSDPNLLGEVIQNLVSNAIRYTERGEVVLECRPGDSALQIEVRDTGIGIESDQLEAIFQEFHQCKTPGAVSEGFGLGLAIVRRLADLLDVEVGVESEPGKGSCFSLAVPLADVPLADEPRSAAPKAERAAADDTIVLIEDDASVANAWTLLLEAEGYRVAAAASCAEAKAMTRHLHVRPALIISDYHLDDGPTGVSAILAIREALNHEIPAFVVSGDTSKVVDDARTLSQSVLLAKPVHPDTLLDLARGAIEAGRVDELQSP